MESAADRDMNKRYRIKPGAKPLDGYPLAGTIVFVELKSIGDNSHFMRVKYSSDEVVFGVVVRAVCKNMTHMEGKHYAAERFIYRLTPAEEYTE